MRKNILITVSILLLGIFFASWCYTNNQKTSPVTTDLPAKQTTSPITFAFGKLVNVYTDNNAGFSLHYPNEATLVQRQDTCPYFIDGPDAKSSLFDIMTPACSKVSENTSIDDYIKDYTEYGEDFAQTFHLISNEPFVTQSGITGLYQRFSVKIVFSQTVHNETYEHSRYIIKLPQKGFLILSGPVIALGSTYISLLEKMIAESVIFSTSMSPSK